MLTEVTERLKFLVAFRPGQISPTLSAQMASTFQRQSQGRLLLNVVTGGESAEQRAYGDFLDKDQRYERTGEFLDIVTRLWQGETVTKQGRHLSVEGAKLSRLPDPIPDVYFGGSSARPPARSPRRYSDVYLTWGEPPSAVNDKLRWIEAQAAEQNRKLRLGIRLHTISRDTSEEAWRQAGYLMERVTDDMIAKVQAGLATSESEGQQRMRALHNSGDRRGLRDLEIHPNLWAGVGLVRGGAGTSLVGSHEEVANLIEEYASSRHHRVHPLRLPAPGGGILVRRGRAADPRTPRPLAAPGPAPGSAADGRPVRAEHPAATTHSRAAARNRSDRRIMTTIAVVTGNPKPNSRTHGVALAVADALAKETRRERRPPGHRPGRARAAAVRLDRPELTRLTAEVAAADIAIFASPTYKAAYTGLLKAFLDRYGSNGLAGVTAVPVMTGGWPGHLLAVEVHLRPVLVELGATVPARGLYVTEPELADLDTAVAQVVRRRRPADQDLNPKINSTPSSRTVPCLRPPRPALSSLRRSARMRARRSPGLKSCRQPGQPSCALSICKGVQQPTETLPAGLEARQRVSALYQTHALALKKLAFLMTGDQPTAEDIVQDAFLGLCRRWPSLHETGQRPRLPPHQRPQRLPVGAPGPVPATGHHPRRTRGHRVGRGPRHPGRGQPRGPGRDPAAADPAARGRRPPLLPGHDRGPGRPGDGRQPGHGEVRHLPGPGRPRSHARGDQVSTEEPMSIEDRVRTATRAAATLVRDIGPMAAEPETSSVPPPPARRRAAGSPGESRSPPRPPSSLLALSPGRRPRHASRNHRRRPRHPHRDGPGPAAGADDGAPLLRGSRPRERQLLRPSGSSGRRDIQSALIVGDDLAGTAIATVSPPSGDDVPQRPGRSPTTGRSWSSAAASWTRCPDAWFLLRIAPGSARPYALAKVPIKLAGGSNAYILAYALSPDDRELAVESQQASHDSGAAVTTLAIYSVSSGAELRAWTTGGYSQELGYPDTLSWLPGGRQLAFSHIPPGGHDADQDQVRTLDVTGHGTDLLAASQWCSR